jgi:hypothetical protein
VSYHMTAYSPSGQLGRFKVLPETSGQSMGIGYSSGGYYGGGYRGW